jgi:hypothetical protein
MSGVELTQLPDGLADPTLAVAQLGSGILLHQQTGGPTAGCVSLRPKDLVAVLRWLRPGTRIAMGLAGWRNRQ